MSHGACWPSERGDDRHGPTHRLVDVRSVDPDYRGDGGGPSSLDNMAAVIVGDYSNVPKS
jgi:hypothetical protein